MRACWGGMFFFHINDSEQLVAIAVSEVYFHNMFIVVFTIGFHPIYAKWRNTL